MLTQYGVIPVRPAADGGVEILLITSRDTKRWVVPRGNPIPGKSPVASAAQEAFEEAGISGLTEPEPLGRYRYDKRRRDGTSVEAEVMLFRMGVQRAPSTGRRCASASGAGSASRRRPRRARTRPRRADPAGRRRLVTKVKQFPHGPC